MEKITITLTKEEWFVLIEVLKSKIRWRLAEENNIREILESKGLQEIQWRWEENNTDDLIKLQEKLIECMTKEQQK